MKKIALLMVSMLFVVGCGDNESAGGDGDGTEIPPISDATISVEVPDNLVTDNSATMIITWTGDVVDGGYVVYLKDKSVFRWRPFPTEGIPDNQFTIKFTGSLTPETIYNVDIFATDKNGLGVNVSTGFKTKAVAPVFHELVISNLRTEKYMGGSVNEALFDLNKSARWEMRILDRTTGDLRITQSGEGVRGEVPLNLINGHDYSLRVMAYTSTEVKFSELLLNGWNSGNPFALTFFISHWDASLEPVLRRPVFHWSATEEVTSVTLRCFIGPTEWYSAADESGTSGSISVMLPVDKSYQCYLQVAKKFSGQPVQSGRINLNI